MIVSNVETGWEVIFQASHALLAGQLADQFHPEHHNEFWTITKAAISQHDQQERFEPGSRDYVTEAGAPRDFTLVGKSSENLIRKTGEQLQDAYRTSRWMGLLQSRHTKFLYDGDDVPAAMRKLLDEEQRRREQILRQLEMTEADLQRSYEVVRWCDRCSLILCQNSIPAEQRTLELITTEDSTRYEIWSRVDGTVAVKPWPFVDDQFEVGTEVYELSALKFEDDADLGAALDECTPVFRRWKFRQD